MNNKYLIKKVIKKIKDKKKYLIAYSGGLDSSALLQILFELNKKYFKNIKLRAIHINHNLNINSNIWVKHCYLFCKKRNIKLIVKNIYIKKNHSLSNYQSQILQLAGLEPPTSRLRVRRVTTEPLRSVLSFLL
ncbi:MAG: ATP-binding protein [Enterobacteriaceae bacterium]